MKGERDAKKAWEEDGEGHWGVREREPERKENWRVSNAKWNTSKAVLEDRNGRMRLNALIGDGIWEVVGFGGNWDLVFEGLFSWDVKGVISLWTISEIWELLDSMQAGKLEPEVAFLNASLIPDIFPLLAAAHKTLIAKSRDSLTTRTLHSELVYNYSGSKHITESLKRCGISDSTTYILAARFNASPDEMKAVEKLVNGKEIELEELEGRANQAQIQKHYKISGLEAGLSSLADAITCRIAARDAL
ncbi:hypothetical protein POTOM_017575 [Populus tomentosa]|uniref:Uncharacterized protein n=1 Tax=Populus tomentosa TaxID=118781 RepID=A0A8X8D4A2_POPTO|nr:hypothetical protein POTOM_017575 [Populus tomentosa]